MSRHRILAWCLVLCGLCWGPSDGWAQSCSFSAQPVNFGTIDLTTGTSFDTASNLTVTCSGLPLSTVQVCVSLGAGSGGAGPGLSPRYMASGTNLLAYNLFTDSGRTSVWGTATGGVFSPATMTVSLGLQGTGNASRQIYGRVLAAQPTVPPGSYLSVLSGTEARINYAYLSALNCLSLVGFTATTSIQVQATVASSCTVSATDVDFGSTSSLSQLIDATGLITARCTTGTPYTIGLNGGTTGATDPTQRRMSGGGGQVTYGLYANSARTLGWGSTAGSNTVAGTGTGANQQLTVYGRIPVQAPKSPGTYSDTIILTLSY